MPRKNPRGDSSNGAIASSFRTFLAHTEGTAIAQFVGMLTHAIDSTPAYPSHPADLASLIRAEYLEMPGLSVTLAQAARLWHVDRRSCLEVLDALTREGFLRHVRDTYVLGASGRLA